MSSLALSGINQRLDLHLQSLNVLKVVIGSHLELDSAMTVYEPHRAAAQKATQHATM